MISVAARADGSGAGYSAAARGIPGPFMKVMGDLRSAEGPQEQGLGEGTDAAPNRHDAGGLAEHLVGLLCLVRRIGTGYAYVVEMAIRF